MEATRVEIERVLRERLAPQRVDVQDDSAKHVGHPGAASGGGHYRVTIVAEAFAGHTRLEQHRMVYDALQELMGERIHALALTTRTPLETDEAG